MTKSEKIADIKMPIEIILKSLRFNNSKFWYISKAVAPKIIGIAKKKENSTIALRSNLRKIPPMMVAPDLETPGIIAKAWHKPISKACFLEIDLILENFGLIWRFSIKKIIRPPIISEMAMTIGENKVSLMKSWPKKPNKTAGMVEIMILEMKSCEISDLWKVNNKLLIFLW